MPNVQYIGSWTYLDCLLKCRLVQQNSFNGSAVAGRFRSSLNTLQLNDVIWSYEGNKVAENSMTSSVIVGKWEKNNYYS